jgi:hypothetical protein
LLKGTGGNIALAVAGSDYVHPTVAVIIDPEKSIVVSPDGTDGDRGTALLAAYAAAKLLTPGGAALSRTNRAQVVLPPGKYKIDTTLILDTDFVDLVALVPEKGGDRQPTDTDLPMANPTETIVVNSRDSFRPSPTLVYTETVKISTILQDCNDTRLVGFSIAQLSAGWRANEDVYTSVGAFKIGDVDNSASIYDTMYFWTVCTENFFGGGVAAYRDFDGGWTNCIGNGFSFVIGKGTFDPTFETSDVYDGKFRARMRDCQGGVFSFIGDGLEDPSADNAAIGCKLIRCKAIGKWSDADTDSGKGSFGGCGFVGVDIDAACYLEECEAGNGSFGLGKQVSAEIVRCVGGDFCFASDGIFSGVAVDSSAGLSSFGGTNTNTTTSYCDGELLRCTYKAGSWPTNLAGAILTNCSVTQVTTNRDCIRLLDGNSVLTNCDFRVVSGGTGVPINAATAKSAAIYHCRLNNVAFDPDGLGSNVTNIADSVINGNAETSSAALGLKSATTTVSVASATAPTARQALVATSGTAAAWTTYGDLCTVGPSEVSITGTTTLTSAAFGKQHVCSGTSSDYAVTLPTASGNAGRITSLRMSAALTKFVTITAAGSDLIDGTSTRIMWAQESAVLLCDGANWTKIAGKPRPMSFVGQNTSGVTVLNEELTPISAATPLSNPTGAMTTTLSGSTVVIIRRPGKYAVSTTISMTRAGSAPGFISYNFPLKNSVDTTFSNPQFSSLVPTATDGAATFSVINLTSNIDFALSDTICMGAFQASGATMTTITDAELCPTISVVECPDW